eukprot:1157613-Pelagomonas_calceolata.AAC.1
MYPLNLIKKAYKGLDELEPPGAPGKSRFLTISSQRSPIHVSLGSSSLGEPFRENETPYLPKAIHQMLES